VSWGLLSTARINDLVLAGAAASDAVDVVAVASRSADRAESYARSRGLDRAYGSYEELLSDPGVEAVYVSLPNGLHVEWAVRCAEAGKHVLVEKPLSPRVSEAERAFDAAQRAGVVMSEAFMWRHNPQTARLTSLVRDGVVGEVRHVHAVFSFPLARAGDPRLDVQLEGGALMDVGCYCVSGARLLLGEPVSAHGVARGEGVDVGFAGALAFEGGATATFDCAFDLPERDSLEVVGSEGTLFLDDPWHCREPGIELRRGAPVERIEVPREDSYRLELEDVSAAIRTGREPLLGRADAVGQARVIEALLDSAGVTLGVAT
jgi:predicted dehydrogenase